MTTQFKSFVEALQFRAANQPNETAYIFLRDGQSDEEKFTFLELDRRAKQIAAALRELAQPGDRVLVNHAPGLEYIASFFGCLYAGVVAVPVYPPRFNPKLDRLVSIAKSCDAKMSLSSSTIYESLKPVLGEVPGLAPLKWLETDRIVDEPTKDLELPTGESLAFLQYTSGSTSDPKGVMLNHFNLLSNVACIVDRFEITQRSCGVIWLPPYHDMGLIGGLLPTVLVGFPLVAMSPYAFVQKPFRWLKAISHYKGTIGGGPNFAFDICNQRVREEQMEGLDLSHWSVAFCGAEPIRKEVLNTFAKKFSAVGFKSEAFCPCYGLAEATLIVTGNKVGQPFQTTLVDADKLELNAIAASPPEGRDARARSLVSCGPVVAGEKMKIVDPVTFVALPERSVGEIWLSGPSIAGGYWKHPEETQTIFKARIAGDTEDRCYLRTGDLGFILNDELYVTGRRKDLLIIRGRNLYPQDIEYTSTSSHVALRSANSAAFSISESEEEKLVVLQEADKAITDEQLDELIQGIRRQVFEDHGLMPHAISILPSNSLPVTSSGKIQRFLCRKLFLEGQLKERKRSLQTESTA